MEDASVRRAALTVALLSSFLTPFMVSSVNIALPSVGREFGADAVTLGWVASSFLLASAMFLLPFGRLGDIHGRKRVFTWGAGVYTSASALCALAPSTPWLIAARAVQGVGAAMIFATSIAILTSVYPPGERGRVLGIVISSTYAGLSTGPFLGGLLTHHLGWRSIFLFSLPPGAAVVWLALARLRGEWADARHERFDLPGSLLYGLSLTSLMYGLSRLPGAAGARLAVAGVAGLALFTWRESRAPNPMLDVRLLARNSVFAFSNLAALVNYSATFAITFLLSLYFQYARGLDPRTAGAVLVTQPAVMALLSPAAGRLSDRLEPRLVASLGMALTTLGLAFFIFLGPATPNLYILAGLAVVGAGFGLFSSPNTNAVMGSVERKHYGVASAVLATMRLTGQMMSMGLAMMVFALYLGRSAVTPDNLESFLAASRAAFAIFALLCLLGVPASLARGRMHNKDAGTENPTPSR